MLSTTPLSRSDGKGALSGVILAGGRNRRMGGSPKALLPYRREKLIHRQIRVMRTICEEVILMTNDPKLYLPIVDRDVRILTDSYIGQGPLGGMHAALSLARCDNAWIIGCDMPFVSARAAQLMRNRKIESHSDADAVIPFIEGRLHPLHGIYDKRTVDFIPRLLDNGQRKVGDFLGMLACDRVDAEAFRRCGIDPGFVLNVNTPEEYEDLLLMDQHTEEGISSWASTGRLPTTNSIEGP